MDVRIELNLTYRISKALRIIFNKSRYELNQLTPFKYVSYNNNVHDKTDTSTTVKSFHTVDCGVRLIHTAHIVTFSSHNATNFMAGARTCVSQVEICATLRVYPS